jgi:hypothetical protein
LFSYFPEHSPLAESAACFHIQCAGIGAAIMAKGQKRSTKEPRKPKKEKPKPVASVKYSTPRS